jgi:hypothetical protein
MPEYSLFVQANVTSDYGGNVYALAFKDKYTETDNTAILTFFDTHKASLTPMTLQTGNQYSTYITDVFTNVDSGDTHAIPYNFSDYSVFVVAQNDLQLTSAGYTGRFNAFSDLSEEELVTNTVIVFHDHVNQDFSVNRVAFSSNIVETVNYYVVGFVDEPAHANLVYDYIDSIKEYEGIYGTDDPFLNRVRVAGTANVPTMTLSTPITHVVKDANVLAPESLYDLNDINAAVFYVYAEGETSGNVSLTRHKMFEIDNVSHARIKSVGFNADSQRVWSSTCPVSRAPGPLKSLKRSPWSSRSIVPRGLSTTIIFRARTRSPPSCPRARARCLPPRSISVPRSTLPTLPGFTLRRWTPSSSTWCFCAW